MGVHWHRVHWRPRQRAIKIDGMDAECSPPPIEDLLAEVAAGALKGRPFARRALHDLSAVDHAVYQAIASTSTPAIDVPVRRLSDAANRSLIWVAASGVLAGFGGHRGRRAAVAGLVAVAHVLGRGERGAQAALRASAPRPRTRRRDPRPPHEDAPLFVIPIRALRVRFRIRDGRWPGDPRTGCPSPVPGGCGGILARPLGSPLPRGRRRRLACRRGCRADGRHAGPRMETDDPLIAPCRRLMALVPRAVVASLGGRTNTCS